MGILKNIVNTAKNFFGIDDDEKKKDQSSGKKVVVGKSVVTLPTTTSTAKKSSTTTAKKETTAKKNTTTKSSTTTAKKTTPTSEKKVAVGKTAVTLPKASSTEKVQTLPKAISSALQNNYQRQQQEKAEYQAQQQAQKNRQNQLNYLSQAATSQERQMKAIIGKAQSDPGSITEQDVANYNRLWDMYKSTVDNYNTAYDADKVLREAEAAKNKAKQEAVKSGEIFADMPQAANNTMFDIDPDLQRAQMDAQMQRAHILKNDEKQNIGDALLGVFTAGPAAAQNVIGQANLLGENITWALSPGAHNDPIQRADHERQVAAWKEQIGLSEDKMEEAYALTKNSDLARFLVDMNYTFAQQGVSSLAGGYLGRAGSTALKTAGNATKAAAAQNAGKIGSNAAQKMAAIEGLSAKTMNGAARYFQKNAPLATMSTIAGAQNYQDAIQNGASNDQAMAYAVLTAAAEAATEKMFGGNPLMDQDAGVINKLAAKMVGDKAFLKALDSVPVETFNEGFEEVVANYLYSGAQELTGQEVQLPTAAENAYSFALGAALGGVGQGAKAIGQMTAQRAQDSETGRQLRSMGAQQELLETGLSMPQDSRANRIAQQITEKSAAGQTVDDAKIGQLYRANIVAQEKLQAQLPTYQQAQKRKQEWTKAQQLAGKLGVQVQIDQSIAAPSGQEAAVNGFYRNSVVHIAQDAENSTMTVLKHELTHRIQDAAPQEYAAFRDFVMQKSGDAAVQQTIDRYAAAGVQLTEQEAMDEIAADYAQQLLTDRGAIDTLIRENPSLAQRIFDAIKRMVRALTGTDEQKTMQKAEKLWTQAYNAAGKAETAQQAEVQKEKNKNRFSINKNKKTNQKNEAVQTGESVQPGESVQLGKNIYQGENGQSLKDMRAERTEVRSNIDRLEWLEDFKGLDAEDAAWLQSLRQRDAELTRAIDERRAEEKKTQLPEAQRIREKAKQEAETTRPVQAKKTLRQNVLDTFHIQAGRRAELGKEIDVIANQILDKGYATASDEANLFWVLYNAGVVVDTSASESYADIRRTLRNTKVYVDEETRADFGDDWNEVRKEAFANGIRLTIKDPDAQGIDQLYADMAEYYPGMFDSRATDEAEMLRELIRAADLGRPEHISLMESAMREGGEDAVAQQMAFFDQYLSRALQNFSDQAGFELNIKREAIRKNADMKALAVEAETRVSQRRAMLDAQNKTLNVFKRLQKMRKKQGPEVQAEIDKLIGIYDTFAKSMRKDTEATWRDLQAIYEEKKSDPNFLPDKNLEARFGRLAALKVGDLTKDEAIELYRAGTQLIHDIQTAGREIAEQNARDLKNIYEKSVEEIQNSEGRKITASKIKMGARTFWDENQLSPLNYIEKISGWSRDGAFYSMGKQLERGEWNKQKYIIESDKLLEKFLEKNADWMAKADGQGKDSIWYEKEIARNAVIGFGSEDLLKMGTVKIYMTPAMKAKLYLDTLNPDNLRHIMLGGIKFPNKELYQKGEINEAYARGITVRLKPESVRNLVKDLTPQEKELAHIIGDLYFNDYAKKAINKTSMLLEGFEKATSVYYSPIYTDHNYLAKKADPAIVDATLEGGGMLKSRVWSGTPTLAVSLVDAFQKHQDFTSKYVGLAIPIRNFNALLNYTEKRYEQSMKNIISQKWGDKAVQYLEDLLVELQNKPAEKKTVVDQLINKGMAGYVKAVFGANPGTVLKQPPGYFMAAARLGFDTMPKTALVRPATRKNRELIAKYTPLLEWRARGNSSRELAELRKNPGWTDKNEVTRFIFGGAIQWMDLHTVSAIWPWAENYVKKYYPELKPGSQKQINAGTDPYYKKVAEVFEDAVANSQPMYDDMHTAQIMKSKSGFTRIFTMFKTAQLTQANALRQAYGEMKRLKAEGKKDTPEGKQAQRTMSNSVAALLISTLAFEAVGMLVNAIKRNGQMRDENGEYSVESLTKYLIDATGRDLAGNIVLGDFVWDAGTAGLGLFDNTWYGVDSIGIDMIEDTVKDAMAAGNEIGKFVGGLSGMKENGDLTYYLKTNGGAMRGAVKDLAMDVSYLLGIPAQNAEAWTLAMISWVNPELAQAYKGKFQDYNKAAVRALDGKPREQKAAVRELVKKHAPDIEQENMQELLRLYGTATDKTALLPADAPDSMTIDGTEKTLSAKNKVDYGKTYDKIVQSGLAEILGSKEYDEMTDEEKAQAIGSLYQYAAEMGKEAAGIGYQTDGWAQSVKSAVDAGASTQHALIFQAATKGMTSDTDENGNTVQGSLSRKKTNWLKESGWSEEEQAALWKSFIASESEKETAQKLSTEGVPLPIIYEVQSTVKTIEPDRDKSGQSIDGSKNKKIFDLINGMSLTDAQKTSMFLINIDSDVVGSDGYKTALQKGIKSWDYMTFYANIKTMTGDKDRNGKTITNSKKKKVLAFIDAMDLTNEQKDALYYAAGYKESTIDECPWRGGSVKTGSSGSSSGSSKKKTTVNINQQTAPAISAYLQKYGEGGGTGSSKGPAPGGAIQKYQQTYGSGSQTGGALQAYLKRYGQ